MRLALSFIAAAGMLAAETQHLDIPAGGTLHLVRSAGQVDIEGWDQPNVEITTDGHVSSNLKGNELIVDLENPKPGRWAWLTQRSKPSGPKYGIKVPRAAALQIEHRTGGIYVDSVTGNVDVSVHDGQITLRLPQDAQYSVDAKSTFGSVVSDFTGSDKREHLFGHEFTGDASQAPQKLKLRIGYGDIIILKARQPK